MFFTVACIAAILTFVLIGITFLDDIIKDRFLWQHLIGYPIVGLIFFVLFFFIATPCVWIYENSLAPPEGRVFVVDLGQVDHIIDDNPIMGFEKEVVWKCRELNPYYKEGNGTEEIIEHETHELVTIPCPSIHIVDADHLKRINKQFVRGKKYILTFRKRPDGVQQLLSFYPKE